MKRKQIAKAVWWFKGEDLPGEIWKTSSDNPRFAVSNLGRIVSLRTPGHGRLICRNPSKSGYIKLPWRKGLPAYAHQLVAKEFMGLCPNGMEVNHKDGIKHNNAVANLEYMNRSQNLKECYSKGYGITQKRKDHWLSKRRPVIRLDAFGHIKEYTYLPDACKDVGIQTAGGNICRAKKTEGESTLYGFKWFSTKDKALYYLKHRRLADLGYIEK